MARDPALKALPEEARKTALPLSIEDLDKLVKERVDAATAQYGMKPARGPDTSHLPTIEEAQATQQALVDRGAPIQAIETTSGWLCHPAQAWTPASVGNRR